MSKSLYIAEKPSVAKEFAKALHVKDSSKVGFMESSDAVVTWCLGHLVTMSYPESYDPRLKKWTMDTLPFIPQEYRYEVIPDTKKQYEVVKKLLHRQDIETIYVCTDSGREGEYIYRLVEQMAGVHGKKRLRVWIDSQTQEEILRGIQEAKDLSEYDHLSDAAYLRAKEDYLMGINFSRVLTLKYGQNIANFLHKKRAVISVGRVMTCVLGMVVRREREIRHFQKTPFYKVQARFLSEGESFEAGWKAVEGSLYFSSPLLYKENGFRKKEDAQRLVDTLKETKPFRVKVTSLSRKTEKKNPPLLYNLAELQNDCSKIFKISPDETLKIAQELYEKRLVTYPRTDARVLSSAAAKEIRTNLTGLCRVAEIGAFAQKILDERKDSSIRSSRYVNDSQITDHYALVPTGQGLEAWESLTGQKRAIYLLIARRFLSIFYPPALYQKVNLICSLGTERFFANFRVLQEEGYLQVTGQKVETTKKKRKTEEQEEAEEAEQVSESESALAKLLKKLKKGALLDVEDIWIKEGETKPPRRYTSGSMILAMENAGQLIEDEQLREQIRGSGIGTSATRAEILKKLITIQYLSLQKRTQIITPTQLGEMVYDVVDSSIRSLLNPELTASWEKGLTYVAQGEVTSEEYMKKLTDFIVSRTNGVKELNNQTLVHGKFEESATYYQKSK